MSIEEYFWHSLQLKAPKPGCQYADKVTPGPAGGCHNDGLRTDSDDKPVDIKTPAFGEVPQGSLTYWGRDKMAGIFWTTFSNTFPWMKVYEFRLRFHWNLF